ncbi:hypothetical protein ACFY41_21440 [Streptomyces syringium]|uniref:hypothetical protein n=1 Tax=Streptomyces syringium TaxID=76729 RepID=UPI0036AC16A6
MATGIDLVQQQLKVAAGNALELAQTDIQLRGAAIECRINAEDPAAGFVPAPGPVERLVLPGGPFVRVDTHVRQGDVIPPHYDSLLAKLVVRAPRRDEAIARMLRALDEFEVSGPGIKTTRAFLAEVLSHPRFRAAEHSTSLVDDLLSGKA